MEKIFKKVALDAEWVLLIKVAKNLGISSEEIREFLNRASKKA